MRPFLISLTLAAALPAGGRLWAASADAIIPVPTAEQHGMARPWCMQVQLNYGRGRVRDMVLHEGVLYVQTDRATITALDAETGHQLWSKMIGRPEHPSMTPDVSSDLLATVNGSRLFVCNRYTGEVLFETQVDGSPGAGPGLSEKFAYVPMVGGMIAAYRLEPLTDPIKELGKVKKDMTPEEKAAEEADRRENLRLRQEYIPPVFCQSAGRALVQPLVTLQNRQEEFVVWPTDRGIVSFGRIDRRDPTALIVNHELKTDADIVSRPAYLPPDPHVHGDMGVIYAASRDGRVYAILEKSGELLWKFPAAEPVLDSPAVINNRVYICTQLGGMFCLDAKNGKQYWWAPEIMHFVAAGKQRVYASDHAGQTQVLSAKTGARLDTLPTEMSPIKVMNTQTDRLYLATDSGLVQCMHELDLAKPILYGEDRKAKPEEEPEKPKPAAKPKTGEGDEKPKPKARPKPSGDKPKKLPKDKDKATADKPVKKAVKDKVSGKKTPDQTAQHPTPSGVESEASRWKCWSNSPINAARRCLPVPPQFPPPSTKGPITMSSQQRPVGLAAIAALLLISRGLLAAEPASHNNDIHAPLNIVLLEERDLPSRGLNFNLQEVLRQRPDVRLHVVDAQEIVRNGVQGDVFCNAHGEVHPVEIEDRLFEFLKQGGGLLHLGGAPFQTAMKRSQGKWTEVVHLFEERTMPYKLEPLGPKKEPFDLFRARIGMLTYVPPYPLDRASRLLERFDSALVGSPETTVAIPRVGINVCSTMPMHAADEKYLGRYSTAYLAKPVCREMHCAGWLDGPDGSPMLTSLALVKSWANPYQSKQSMRMRPWAIFTGQVEGKLPRGLLDAMIAWLACPVCLRPVDLPLATTRRGETVQPTCELVGRLPAGWRVRGRRAEVSLDDFKAEPIHWMDADAKLSGSTAAMRITDDADVFLIPVRFEIVDEKGRVRDYAESAVVPWRPEKLRAGPKLAVDGRYFDYRDGSLAAPACFLVGANWQDRVQYGFTWHNPNGLRVAGDALKMAAAGMRIVRPHYMMPGWMRTVPWQIYAQALPGVYDQFELGPEISERHLRAIEAHVMIFNSLGIVFQPSIFTLPPPQMGHTECWWDTARLASCPGLVDNQKRFSRQIMERLGAIPGISWDLVNEPSLDMTIFGPWLAEMKTIWGQTGQLVGIGGVEGLLNNVRQGESADWHAVHGNPVVLDFKLYTGKPNLMQEVHLPTATTPKGETEAVNVMSLGVALALREQATGFMPWNWNQFYTNWRYGGSFVECWDNDLGSCVHADATPRAGGIVLRNWAAMLDGVSFDQRAGRQVVFLYPKRFYSGGGTADYLQSLYQHGIPFRSINDADLATADLAGAKLIIVPYTGLGCRESTWKRLREFAAAGGAVFAHNDVLMLDQDGRVAESRHVTLSEGRERLAAGWFEWTMGWNSNSPDLVLGRLAGVFDELKVQRCKPQSLPLQGGGEMRFRQKLHANRTTMKHDWNPARKLPDRLEPTVVEIVDRDGRLTRGWSGDGETIECDGMKFHSPEQFFLIRKDPGCWQLWGGEITVSGAKDIKHVSLVDPISHRVFDDRPNWQHEGDKLTIRLDGRQRLMWAELRR